MPVKPCACEFGHKFFESDAEQLNFKCDKCGTKITCPVAPSAGLSTMALRTKAKTAKAKPAKAKKRR